MDYGQNPQSVNPESEQAFFTAGAGVNSESANNVNPENNLDLTNQAINWNETTVAKHQNLGNRAIFSPESPESPKSLEENEKVPTGLGEVVNLEMPPSFEPLAQAQPDLATPKAPFERKAIRTTEKLEPSGIREVDNIINKLSQDGDAATFYTSARDMMEANMENSYGDKAAWKGAAWQILSVLVFFTTDKIRRRLSKWSLGW